MQSPLSPSHPRRVISITVAFNPEAARLAKQLETLRGQVDQMIIVDNGSQPSVRSILEHLDFGKSPPIWPDVKFVALKENCGVASGFNNGIETAVNDGAEFVLLLDHDSIPRPGMVSKLLTGYQRAVDQVGVKSVAAVGPRIIDSRDANEYPFIRMGWLKNQHLHCVEGADSLIECDFLISSGSLIPVNIFPKVGMFDEELFIDSVDLEWCCRARARHFYLYGICETHLDHLLGDQRQLVIGGMTLVVHSPLRIYYMTRNRILLYWRSYMPLKWKLKDMLRMLAKFFVTMLFIGPRLEYLRLTIRAIRDAIAHRGGRLRNDGL